MKNILVVSAHPDDEVLGAGGTLLKHLNSNDNLYWLVTTTMAKNQNNLESFNNRKVEINKIKKIFNFKKSFFLNYITSTLTENNLAEMIISISKILKDIKPEIIYCVNRVDAHSDHRITCDAVLSCTKSFRNEYIKRVLLYECISETEFAPAIHQRIFVPNYYVDISDYIDKKIDAMKVYSSELGEHPFPRSIKNIKAISTFRGAIAGVSNAEAFQLIKFIDK